MSRIVGIMIDGEISTHASGRSGPSDYATLCGLDGAEPGHQETVPLMPGALIDCEACLQLWSAWCTYSAKDFKRKGARK